MGQPAGEAMLRVPQNLVYRYVNTYLVIPVSFDYGSPPQASRVVRVCHVMALLTFEGHNRSAATKVETIGRK